MKFSINLSGLVADLVGFLPETSLLSGRLYDILETMLFLLYEKMVNSLGIILTYGTVSFLCSKLTNHVQMCSTGASCMKYTVCILGKKRLNCAV